MATMATTKTRQPRMMSRITQAGLNTRIFDMMVKSQDDLRWFHNFKTVNLFPVFVFNTHFMPEKQCHKLSPTKTDLGTLRNVK